MARKKKNSKKQDSKTNASTESTFDLVSLPPELWSWICRLAVIRDKPIEISSSMTLHNGQELVRPPPITLTCKTIREETINTFYANTFILDDRSSKQCLLRWLQFISTNNQMQKLLPNMVVRGHWLACASEPYYVAGFIKDCQDIGMCLKQLNDGRDPKEKALFKVVPFVTTDSSQAGSVMSGAAV
ncbi:hypothetical protein LTR56_011095 [Elasticomyces elasticus]|nr:hypothetical protein LTR56_011095 [Elasticomyces elasticus]KAK3662484.1 hypothetical protein LTR22_006763 [Elasticomyces elasticus]KAK4926473.1 hypothetical protein LTR49_006680 [Elasticomyces elasticus]KAK5761153.1 hypothetical protein LTS12_008634 [Elasticomyces elasticus]